MWAPVLRLETNVGIGLSTIVILAATLSAQQPDTPRATSSSGQSQSVSGTSGRTEGSGDAAVTAARERYAAAEYEDALALLDEVKPEHSDLAARVSVEQYRALCLLALGRQQDAREAIARLVTLDPAYDVDNLDVSPSVKKQFLDVRARVLPSLARDEYEAGKAAFERKAYVEAAPHLRKAVSLADAAVASGADDASVRDVSTLAKGFLDLATATAAPSQGEAGANELSSAANGATTPDKSAPGNGSSGVPTRPAAPPTRHIPVVADPVPVRQVIPPISPQLRQLASGRGEGVLEVTVDETGRVTTAVMIESIYPVYDGLLLQAARNWRYQPATIDGKPVARTVTVRVRPQ